MAYDLALSDHGDLVISGSRDLAGVSGTDLLEQRIRVRLIVTRDTWVLNPEFGSLLQRAINLEPTLAQDAVDGFVREALADMNEITVVEVQVDHADHHISLNVRYQVLGDTDGAETDIRELQVTLHDATEAGGL